MKKRRIWGLLLCVTMVLGIILPAVQTASAQSYTITVPKGGRKDLTVSQNSNSITMTLKDLKGTAKLKGKPDWVTNCPTTTSSSKISPSVSYNNKTTTRSGDIVYQDLSDNKTYTLHITQEKYTIGASTSSITLLASGYYSGTNGASITVSGNGTIGYSKDSKWIKISQTSSTSSNGRYTKSYVITADPNTGASSRTGYIEFSAGGVAKTKVKVTQKANTLTGVPASKRVGNEGTSFSFTATAGTGTITAKSSNTAIATVSVSGTKVSVFVKANLTDTKDRSVTVSVSAGSLTRSCVITQDKCRTDVTFPHQADIEQDLWTDSNRSRNLTSFYDRLKQGAESRKDTTAASILSKAKTVTCFSWTCLNTFKGWKNKWTFNANQVYYGAPYQQGKTYVGHDCTVKALQDAASKKDGDFYKNTYTGPSHGTDCSGFATYCLGIKRKDTSEIKADFSKAGDIKANAQSGDLLYIEYFDSDGKRTGGHVLLLASVIRDKDNNLKGVVVLESQNRTTASGRNIHVYYDNDATLRQLFNNASIGTCKEILQYVIDKNNTGTIDEFYKKYKNTHTLMRK